MFVPSEGTDGTPSTRWYQGNWRVLCGRNRCATGLCLAGYVCEVTGGRWLVTADASGNLLIAGKRELHEDDSFRWQHLLVAEPDDRADEVETTHNHATITAAQRARRLLGIDQEQVDELVKGGKTRPRLVELGTAIFGANDGLIPRLLARPRASTIPQAKTQAKGNQPMGTTTRKTTKRKRPHADFTPEQLEAWKARKHADKRAAIAARAGAAALLAQRSDLIDAFRVYASRVMGHHSLGNALGMMAQNPGATRVNSAFFWAREGQAVLPDAEPMCVLARRKGNKIVERENPDTGETEETVEGKWSGWTGERVFDVRDTVPAKKPCQRCGTEPGQTCPDSCQVYEPVTGPAPTREEVADLLDEMLREEGGFDLDFAEAARDEAHHLDDEDDEDAE